MKPSLKKYLLSVITLFVIIGCGAQPYKSPQPTDKFGTPPKSSIYKKEIQRHFDATLIDPYSAKYIYQKPVKAYSNYWLNGTQSYWQGWAIVVNVNSKNRFGGYVGGQNYAFIFDGNKINSFFKGLDLVKLVK